VHTSAAMQTSANITHWKIMKEFTTSWKWIHNVFPSLWARATTQVRLVTSW
jgi:hypothetical protein